MLFYISAILYRSEPTFSHRSRRTSSETQEDDSDEESEDDGDDNSDDDKMKKSLKKAPAEKKHKWKVSEADDSEEDEAEEHHFDKGKVKVAARKKSQKISMIMKSSKKKRIKTEEEESETDDDTDEDMAEIQVTPKLLKGHKRKKDEVIKVESKKMKLESHQDDDDDSSDEDSTPIALLKAILKEESTPISQLKDKLKEESIPISKLKAELKEESIPISQLKAKLKDPSSAAQHQAKVIEASHPASEPNIKSTEDLDAFSQLQAQIRLKREVEKKASSSQGRSLMERLADGTLDLSVDYSSPFHSLKRKQMASGADASDEVPSKVYSLMILICKIVISFVDSLSCAKVILK